jgi:hypothetical protein
MFGKQLENFLEQERRYKLGASIARFAGSAEGSDEEKANCKREEATENQATQQETIQETKRTKETSTYLEKSSGGRNHTYRQNAGIKIRG